MVALLIEEMADINASDKSGKTALHYAAEREDLPMVLYLLLNKAESSIADRESNVPGANNGRIRMFIDDVALIHLGLRGEQSLWDPRT